MTGRDRGERIRCDACPVLCYIRPGSTGACDRYANVDGRLVRLDPLTVIERARARGTRLVPFLRTAEDWDGMPLPTPRPFVTAVGAGTTYPDYKPAPFIVAARVEGVDTVTVVSEGIFSYCGVKVKIDCDRHIGDERAVVYAEGEPVGHVTTSEYGATMLSLGGVEHLTGGSKREGRVTCRTLLALCNREAVELEVEEGARLVVQAGRPPVVNGRVEERMRVGCGSATIGMFATRWAGRVEEVVVVDDHITGVLSEHQAGRVLGMEPSGIRIRGHRSTPGRYFRVASPGQGWGGTDIRDPLEIVEGFDPARARPGMRLLMLSTTGEHAAYFELDEELRPVEKEMPAELRESVELVAANCEPALCSVLFMAGAGGSLRAGVTRNPIALTRSVRDLLVRVTSGGAPTYLWPGGGITFMVDVTKMPQNAFGHVPTPALVAPIEFTMRREDYEAIGGHIDRLVELETVLAREDIRRTEEV